MTHGVQAIMNTKYAGYDAYQDSLLFQTEPNYGFMTKTLQKGDIVIASGGRYSHSDYCWIGVIIGRQLKYFGL